jgi:hypothetical protein
LGVHGTEPTTGPSSTLPGTGQEKIPPKRGHPADFTIRPDGVCRLNPEMCGACGKVGHRGAKGKSSQIKFLPNARFSLKVRAWLGGKEGS